jgi:hypothetical protein
LGVKAQRIAPPRPALGGMRSAFPPYGDVRFSTAVKCLAGVLQHLFPLVFGCCGFGHWF